MAKPFKTKILATASNPYVKPNEVYWGNPSTAYCINLTKIRIGAYSSWGMISWLAIGF